jgi:hypothetical protein
MEEIYLALGTRIYVRGNGVDSEPQVVERDDYVVLVHPAESELEGSQLDKSTTEQSAHEANVKIAEEVSAALAEDPKTSASVIEVVYDRGVITLSGIVENEEAHTSAEEIARRHEGVVSVVNALEVRQESPFYDSAAHAFGGLLQRPYLQFS